MTIALPWRWRRAWRRFGAKDKTAEKVGRNSGDGLAPYVTVYSARSMPEAYVVKGRLEAEDIPVILKYDTIQVTMAPLTPLKGVNVQVPRALAERAMHIIGEDEPSQPAPPAGA